MNLFRRLHNEESAQISFLAVAGVVCFVGLLSMVINTNDIIGERVHMQDVADSTSMSAAAWTARGLNTISFINVMNTKLISAAVLLNALSDTLPILESVAKIQLAIFNGCSGVPFIGPFCVVMARIVDIQIQALNVLKNSVVNPLADRLSKCSGNKILWKSMKGLEKLGQGVRATFSAIGMIESVKIAQANGATAGIVVNGALSDPANASAEDLMLPVKAGNFDDHCPHITSGGPGFELQGYNCNQGPLEAGRERIKWTLLVPFTTLIAQPIYSTMVRKHNKQIGCTNKPGEDNEKIPVSLTDLAQCRKHDVSARWAHVWSQTPPLTAAETGGRVLTRDDFIPWRPRKQPTSSDTGKAAEDEGTIRDQLGDLNLPSGGTSPGNQQVVPVGRGNEFIPENNEGKRDLGKMGCRYPRYPFYIPPPVRDWENVPGLARSFNVTLSDSKRIDEWDEFDWFSGNHQSPSTDESTGGYFFRFAVKTIEPPEEEENGVDKFIYFIEAVSLVDSGTKEMTDKEFEQHVEENGGGDVNMDGTQSSGSCTEDDKPKPWMLDNATSAKKKEMEQKLRFIGVVWKDIDPPFWSGFFDQPPKRLIAYSQAQVYNYLSEDTFTQDWRVRMEEANLLKNFMENGPGSALGGFGSDMVDAVNNH